MICDINTSALLEVLDSLKREHGKLITNSFRCFPSELDRIWRVIYNSKALIILITDNGVIRIEFFATDITDLKGLVDELPTGEYDLEFLYRKENPYLSSFMSLGFELYKTMMRYCNYDIGRTLEENKLQLDVYRPLKDYVVLDQMQFLKIKHLLFDAFDPRISHIPCDEDLHCFIDNGEFLGITIGDQLATLLQRKLENRRFYINQVINTSEPIFVHSIMIDELEKYVKSGGKYVYSWIASDNTASIRFHQKYGLKPDLIMNDNMTISK